MKHPKQVGMSCKNTRFVKKGLTKDENIRVLRKHESDRQRWEELFKLNKRPFNYESIPAPKGDRLEQIRKEVDKALADFRQSIIDGK
jgi:hypothetical protein